MTDRDFLRWLMRTRTTMDVVQHPTQPDRCCILTVTPIPEGGGLGMKCKTEFNTSVFDDAEFTEVVYDRVVEIVEGAMAGTRHLPSQIAREPS